VEHTEGDGKQMFQAICKLGLEGIVSKKLNASLQVRPVENLDQGQKSEGTRRTRAIDGTF
jgi:hypothetical protein